MKYISSIYRLQTKNHKAKSNKTQKKKAGTTFSMLLCTRVGSKDGVNDSTDDGDVLGTTLGFSLGRVYGSCDGTVDERVLGADNGASQLGNTNSIANVWGCSI